MQSNKDTFMHNPFLNPVDYSLFPNIRKDRHLKKKHSETSEIGTNLAALIKPV